MIKIWIVGFYGNIGNIDENYDKNTNKTKIDKIS